MLSREISFQNKRILICPLDWGLGHASRCVPLIKQLQRQNNKIIVACNQKLKTFLLDEISGVEFVDLFGYEVRYSKTLPLWMKILFQFPRLSRIVRKENAWLNTFLKKNNLDVVISDNRFGLFNENIESVFMTHQVFIQAPFLSKRINYLNHIFIKKFDQCWIPDFKEKERSLSGALSYGKPVNKNTIFIGPLSRFTKQELPLGKIFDLFILLSGVEPQRSLMEEKLVNALRNTKLKIALVRGTTDISNVSFPKNFTVTNIASTKQLETLFLTSEHIICRPGYSTLMDLHAIGRKALLIPTPGQTEQEYLSAYWKNKFDFNVVKQNEINEEIPLNLLIEKETPVAQI